MMDDKTKELLRISYSNNVALLEIDEKMRKNEATIKDLEALLTMRDAKDVWTSTTINMVLASALFTGLAKWAFELPNKDFRTILASLSIGCTVLGYVKYREELAEQKRIKEYALLNEDVVEDENYNSEQLNIIKKEQKVLKIVREKIVNREVDINSQLSDKKLIKK